MGRTSFRPADVRCVSAPASELTAVKEVNEFPPGRRAASARRRLEPTSERRIVGTAAGSFASFTRSFVPPPIEAVTAGQGRTRRFGGRRFEG